MNLIKSVNNATTLVNKSYTLQRVTVKSRLLRQDLQRKVCTMQPLPLEIQVIIAYTQKVSQTRTVLNEFWLWKGCEVTCSLIQNTGA